jgi:phospholipase C
MEHRRTPRTHLADIDHGNMDGFVKTVESSGSGLDTDKLGCTVNLQPPNCADVMGYHDQREIPNYWSYAKNFVLPDHMFEPSQSWSLVSHLYMVSGWSAKCSNGYQPSTCAADNTFPDADGVPQSNNPLLIGANPLLQQATGAAAGILQPNDADDVANSSVQPDYGWAQ